MTKLEPKKYFIFKTAPYETDVLFLNGTTEKEAIKILKKYEQGKDFINEIKELFSTNPKGFCITDKENIFLIYVRDIKDKAVWHETIAHELQHLVSCIYKITDWKYDSENIEPHCHLTGYITKQVYKNLLNN